MRALALPISPWLIPSRGCTVGPMSGGSGTDAAGADSPEQRAQEAQLARRAADGDGAAFATLYDRYEQRIFTFCQRLTGSADDAADATQEAFVSMLERLPGLTGRDLNFGAYLFTTARHSAYRELELGLAAEEMNRSQMVDARALFKAEALKAAGFKFRIVGVGREISS